MPDERVRQPCQGAAALRAPGPARDAAAERARLADSSRPSAESSPSRSETPRSARAIRRQDGDPRGDQTDAELIRRGHRPTPVPSPSSTSATWLACIALVRSTAFTLQLFELDLVAETFAQAALSLGRYRDPGDWQCGRPGSAESRSICCAERTSATAHRDERARAARDAGRGAAEIDIDAIAERLDAQVHARVLRSSAEQTYARPAAGPSSCASCASSITTRSLASSGRRSSPLASA